MQVCSQLIFDKKSPPSPFWIFSLVFFSMRLTRVSYPFCIFYMFCWLFWHKTSFWIRPFSNLFRKFFSFWTNDVIIVISMSERKKENGTFHPFQINWNKLYRAKTCMVLMAKNVFRVFFTTSLEVDKTKWSLPVLFRFFPSSFSPSLSRNGNNPANVRNFLKIFVYCVCMYI